MQTPQPSVLNHFNSLPDNLNNYKPNNDGVLLTGCGDDDEKANNDDDLTDNKRLNASPPPKQLRSLSHSLNNKTSAQNLYKKFESSRFNKHDNKLITATATTTKLTSTISKPFSHLIKIYKKLDSDSNSG